MSRKIKSYKFISGREILEKERQRLLNVPKEPGFKKWLEDREYPLDWMKKQFGETLIEKEGLVHASGHKFDDHRCSVCGKCPDIDERFLTLDFSFCEYGCWMNICLKCLKKFNNESKKHDGIDFDLKKKFDKAFKDIREGKISELKDREVKK